MIRFPFLVFLLLSFSNSASAVSKNRRCPSVLTAAFACVLGGAMQGCQSSAPATPEDDPNTMYFGRAGTNSGLEAEMGAKYLGWSEKASLYPLYEQEIKALGWRIEGDLYGFFEMRKNGTSYLFAHSGVALKQYSDDLTREIRARVKSISGLPEPKDVNADWVIQLHQIYRALLECEKYKIATASLELILDSESSAGINVAGKKITISFEVDELDREIDSRVNYRTETRDRKYVYQNACSFGFGVKGGAASVGFGTEETTLSLNAEGLPEHFADWYNRDEKKFVDLVLTEILHPVFQSAARGD